MGIEVVVLLEGYHAVMARALTAGLSGEVRRQWEARLAAQHGLIGALVPGGSAAELARRVEGLQAAFGLPGESLMAHGIWLSSIEEPFLGPFPEAGVEAGMVLAVGPEGTPPWRLRDMVLVSPDGPELLTHRTDPGLDLIR